MLNRILSTFILWPKPCKTNNNNELMNSYDNDNDGDAADDDDDFIWLNI